MRDWTKECVCVCVCDLRICLHLISSVSSVLVLTEHVSRGLEVMGFGVLMVVFSEVSVCVHACVREHLSACPVLPFTFWLT